MVMEYPWMDCQAAIVYPWVLEPVEGVNDRGCPSWRQTTTEETWNLEASSMIAEFPPL